MGGAFGPDSEIPLPVLFFYLFRWAGPGLHGLFLAFKVRPSGLADSRERHCQVGSLAGAAHLLKDNAGVLRGAHRERKSRVEQKGKSPLDFDFQCEYKP